MPKFSLVPHDTNRGNDLTGSKTKLSQDHGFSVPRAEVRESYLRSGRST